MNSRWAAATVAGGAVLGVLVVVGARLAGWAVPVSLAVLAGTTAGLLAAVAARLPTTDPPPSAPVPTPEPPASASFGDLGSLRFAVETDSRDGDRFEVRLRPRLAGLTVERLWQRRGIDWRTDAGRAAARDVLTPALLELLTAPPHTLRSTPQTLLRWTRDLEDL
ncbi:hypothetical protein SAMN05661080_01361 [Modestobacter sp. DSM 44400]|uniref:hypothetical protein n=1 Tax=Modestobacter sp. DSM 44400 TaxID=1550230 RepID=UPI00089A2977|nr:hypothetical protein [Modestobacter sp. DSM 44400]SDX83045.1 hypothetical protein SAMN05661080_01361 [Modestobacter sp. DSM 44400]